ncbi:MAG TPA: tetratricopeptide repeat protein [Candidatus Eremiobacteraeota bacterium]|nr:MAG: Tetratricopeptide repeat protein [bacterium ADurb.Bin363]HPZ08698.1 tetratricopeptide repeat protein [Candidatus Eremiobacteraeota bacterium]
MKSLTVILLFTIILLIPVYAQGTDESLKKIEEAILRGNYQTAIDYLKAGASTHPEYYYYLGLAYQKLGDFKSGMEYYKVAIDKCPVKSQQAYIGLAQCEEAVNNPSAFTHYKKAVSFIPEYKDIFNITFGQATQAKIDEYKILLEFHPKDSGVLKKLVILYEGKGQLSQGISTLKYILKNNGVNF